MSCILDLQIQYSHFLLLQFTQGICWLTQDAHLLFRFSIWYFLYELLYSASCFSPPEFYWQLCLLDTWMEWFVQCKSNYFWRCLSASRRSTGYLPINLFLWVRKCALYIFIEVYLHIYHNIKFVLTGMGT